MYVLSYTIHHISYKKYGSEISLNCSVKTIILLKGVFGLLHTPLVILYSSGGPWAPFENSWHLKEDYRKAAKRHELAAALSKHILWLAIVNLILCPLILLWQILYSFFTYAEVTKLL